MVQHPNPWRQSSLAKPRFRGRLHRIMVPVSAAAGAIIVATAPTVQRAGFVAVFAVSVTLMFFTSALYHTRWWTDRGWQVARRLDQTGIYLLIGGTYTGIFGLGVDGALRTWLLVAVWAAIAAGLAILWTPFRLPLGLQTGLFIALGWLALAATPALWTRAGVVATLLTLLAGAIYTAGAIMLGLRRPDPWPRHFGYHELWHVMVVVALSVHAAVVVLVLHDLS